MDPLPIIDDDFGPLERAAAIPTGLELERCDLVTHGPPRELAGLEKMSIHACRLTPEALQRWTVGCPDLRNLDLEGVDIGGLGWKQLPCRLRSFSAHAGRLNELVDPPAVSGIVHLDLENCGLERLELLPSMPSLERISLSHNGSLRGCPDLPWSARPFRLDLDSCDLTRWPMVAGAEKVSALDLSCNRMQAWPDALDDWSGLESLRIKQCGLRRVGRSIRSLTALRELLILENPLEEWPHGLHELPALRVLLLPGCRLAEVPAAVGELSRLEVLELHRNPLRELPEEILQLRNLRRLGLWHTQLDRLPPSLSDLSRLRLLDVGYTSLTRLPDMIDLGELDSLGLCGLRRLDWEQGFEVLAGLRQVREISFTDNEFEHFDRRVMEIPGLQRININKTRVAPGAWQALREEFPNVVVWGA